MALDLFAGARVGDYHAAKSWYERLLGREPTFIAHATGGGLGARRPPVPLHRGGSRCARRRDHHDHRRRPGRACRGIASRGIEPAERVTYSNGVRKAIYRDADGNEIGFGGVPD